MSAYYNEVEPYAVQWLRNLIAAGLIAPGDVDDRPIQEVQPDDVAGYTQCHFFAGLGGWSHAARLAGWADSRSLWTGSCPCQPFSVAGRRQGVEDPRHLWPHFYRIIRGARPALVMGEQTSGAPGYAWLDGVGTDLEAEAYTWRAVDIPACSVNAPEIRNRLYWVALSNDSGLALGSLAGEQRENVRHKGTPAFAGCAGDVGVAFTQDERHARARGARDWRTRLADGGLADGVGIADGAERRPDAEGRSDVDDRPDSGRQETAGGSELAGAPDCGLGGTNSSRCDGEQVRLLERRSQQASLEAARTGSSGFWDDWQLIGPDPDGKYRRIKSGLAPLVTRLPGHVGQIRAYGNAINAELAAEVIRAWMDTEQAHEA